MICKIDLEELEKPIEIKKREWLEHTLLCLAFGALMVILICTMKSAVDTYAQNQDRMLCRSALVSRNSEYLTWCAERGFYSIPYEKEPLKW